jgi:hypothetical protein
MTELHDRIAELALAMPEVTAKESHGSPCFFLRDKKPLCYFHPDGSHGNDRPAIWCRAPEGANDEMSAAEPQRFFRPTPSASGVFASWIGVYLDDTDGHSVDWKEVDAVLRDAYRQIAPKKFIAQLDA